MSFKKLLFNDPIYGFIPVNYEIIFRLIQHPYFQRLRHIRQLGLTYLVFPGAMHTRFQHAMGAMYLTGQAIEILRSKGNNISDEEAEAVSIAILLHDIGHGPFSHVLENSIVNGVNHETISALMMKKLNEEFDGKLSLAIEIFNNKYRKKFLHQLVSSQLDMDRMDYLKRDSFYSGVSEGIVSWERIIIMLNVAKVVRSQQFGVRRQKKLQTMNSQLSPNSELQTPNYEEELAIDAKGIYPVEKFIIARRLMYWQVYLHKTVIAAEMLLVNILKRAKEISNSPLLRRGVGGEALFSTPALNFFLKNNLTKKSFEKNPEALQKFAQLDDNDIFTSVKVWASHNDKILSKLSKNIIDRNLPKVEIQNQPFTKEKISTIKNRVKKKFNLSEQEADYFVFSDKITNSAYNPQSDKINILFKDGTVKDLAEASDQNIFANAKPVVKYYLCYPKEL